MCSEAIWRGSFFYFKDIPVILKFRQKSFILQLKYRSRIKFIFVRTVFKLPRPFENFVSICFFQLRMPWDIDLEKFSKWPCYP